MDLFGETARHPEGPVFEAHAILRRAVGTYRPRKIWALFSGGHDSLCASHVASSHEGFLGCVHVNTGIGVEETRSFVRATCLALGWPLLELHPPPFIPARGKRRPGIDYEHLPAYEAIILHHGFPGPAGHRLVYNRLKERCLRALRRRMFGPRRRPADLMLLVGGMRRAESVRRMGNAEEMSLELSEGRAWCSPLVYWTDQDKDSDLTVKALPRNPVVERLCMSGECLCGAFAKREERAEIGYAYPAALARIESLEVRAQALGVHAVWGRRPPRRQEGIAGQSDLPGLCWSCRARAGRNGGT